MKIRSWMQANQNKIWAWIIGGGLVLFAFHNPEQPLIQYAFLPVVGLSFSMIAAFVVVLDNRARLTVGNKIIWIPMVLMLLSIALSGLVNGASLGEKVAPLILAVYLFSIYLSARILGKDMFTPFTIAVIVAAISCVYYSLFVMPAGVRHGGWVSPTNYDIAAGLLVFGTVVSAANNKWWVSAIALMGLMATGAPEGLFAVVVLFIMVLARKDFSWHMALPVVVVVLLGGLWFAFGGGLEAWRYTWWATDITGSLNPDIMADLGVTPMGDRWSYIVAAMTNISWIGHGYVLTAFTYDIVHNIPLIIVDQVGPVAGAAWLFVTVYMLIKTKWHYAFASVLALGAFDHYLWTQVAPWWWALAGVALVSEQPNDYIFKGVSIAKGSSSNSMP